MESTHISISFFISLLSLYLDIVSQHSLWPEVVEVLRHLPSHLLLPLLPLLLPRLPPLLPLLAGVVVASLGRGVGALRKKVLNFSSSLLRFLSCSPFCS